MQSHKATNIISPLLKWALVFVGLFLITSLILVQKEIARQYHRQAIVRTLARQAILQEQLGPSLGQ